MQERVKMQSREGTGVVEEDLGRETVIVVEDDLRREMSLSVVEEDFETQSGDQSIIIGLQYLKQRQFRILLT